MKSRITELRKSLALTQDEFAKRLGLSRNYIWMIEKGERIPPDRTISDICRIFNVNPNWIRNGEEPMLMPEPDDDTEYINELLNESDNPFVILIKSIMSVYMDLSPEDKKKARDFAAGLSDKIKENRS